MNLRDPRFQLTKPVINGCLSIDEPGAKACRERSTCYPIDEWTAFTQGTRDLPRRRYVVRIAAIRERIAPPPPARSGRSVSRFFPISARAHSLRLAAAPPAGRRGRPGVLCSVLEKKTQRASHRRSQIPLKKVNQIEKHRPRVPQPQGQPHPRGSLPFGAGLATRTEQQGD